MEQGSLRSALKGDYELSVGETLAEAWHRTEGAKFTFLASVFVYLVILVIVGTLFAIIFNLQAYQDAGSEFQALLAQVGVDLLSMPIEIPMFSALFMMGVRHVNGRPIEVGDLFNYYVMVWPLVFASILVYLFIAIGMVLLILPGIYLSVAYIFVYPLMIDKRMGVWEAMETSRKAVTRHWFTFFGILLAMGLVTLLSALPLGIGLIWTLPMGYLVYGIMYTKVFGYADEEENGTTFGEEEEEEKRQSGDR
jgi:membrane-anchored glycerophosphoryl diester phosphodiesterase (GDPDase)